MLGTLLERMGAEHPHHTLWQLFALAHGNMDKHGRAIAPSDQVLQQQVDHSKVAAAGQVLSRVAKRANRRAPMPHAAAGMRAGCSIDIARLDEHCSCLISHAAEQHLLTGSYSHTAMLIASSLASA